MPKMIDREHLISILIGKMKYESDFGFREGLQFAIDKARELPELDSPEAEPVQHGRWEKSPTGNGYFVYCSECGAAADAILAHKYKGCPFCLCEIDGGADDATDRR